MVTKEQFERNMTKSALDTSTEGLKMNANIFHFFLALMYSS